MFDFCVAIRAYNAERYLPNILDALRSQNYLENVKWEVVLVDNGSTDKTAKIFQEYQEKWLSEVPLRYFYEPQQGSSFARRRAIEEANAPLIGFLDDDNVPEGNWVSAAQEFARMHPNAAAFGSQIHGVYEIEPPPGFERIAGFIPIVERKNSVCFTQGKYAQINMMPPGAGLVIRRQVWLDHVPSKLILRGPVGRSLAKKGEDIEGLTYLKKAGWEIWYNADMHIYHQIPKSRFEREYLMRFFKGWGLSKFYTRTLAYSVWQKPFITSAFILNDSKKIILHLIRYRLQSRNELVTACEFQLLIYSFLGPFYAFRENLENWKNSLLDGND